MGRGRGEGGFNEGMRRNNNACSDMLRSAI